MGTVSELRLPADREHILVAKRAAAAFGSLAGFDMDAIDDLTIAVAQACENAIRCLEHSGSIAGQVRIVFKQSDTGARGQRPEHGEPRRRAQGARGAGGAAARKVSSWPRATSRSGSWGSLSTTAPIASTSELGVCASG